MTMPTFTDGAFMRQGPLNLLSYGINAVSTLLNGASAPRQYIPEATASINTTHAIPTSTDTLITYDVVGINNDAITSVGQSAFVIRTGGVYVAHAQACFAANSTGIRILHILLNGTIIVSNAVARATVRAPSSSDLALMSAQSPPMALAPGSVIYSAVWQSSGGNLNISNALSGTSLSVIRGGNQ